MDVTADELDRLRRVPLLTVTQMNAEAGQDVDGRPVEEEQCLADVKLRPYSIDPADCR